MCGRDHDTVPIPPAGPRGGGGGASSRRGRSRDARGGAARQRSEGARRKRERSERERGRAGAATRRFSTATMARTPALPLMALCLACLCRLGARAIDGTTTVGECPATLLFAPFPPPLAPTVADGAAPPALVPCSALGAERGGAGAAHRARPGGQPSAAAALPRPARGTAPLCRPPGAGAALLSLAARPRPLPCGGSAAALSGSAAARRAS